MTDDSSRLDASIEWMQAYYPAFHLSVVETEAGREAIWTGRVQPIRTIDWLEELLDDIHHERPFYILPGGEVLHHPACVTSHTHHGWAEKLPKPYAIYELEVRYGGSRRHPKAYVRDPILPEKKRNHMFGDGSLCPYSPWQQIWRWEDHTVVDYMAHVLGWLIKWTVWDQASIWIGTEVSHDPRFLLRIIGRNESCWCGSEKKYKKCHRPTDEERAQGQC